MKTTLNIRGDLYRKAKAQAALQGISLGKFIEESIEKMLSHGARQKESFAEWAEKLPAVSDQAAKDLENALAAPDFRAVDPEMWS